MTKRQEYDKKYNKKWLEKNRERRKAYHKKWHDENKAHEIEYRQKKKKEILAYGNLWRKNNKEKRNEKVSAYNRKWALEHKEQRRAINAKRNKKLRLDPQFRIAQAVRGGIRRGLNGEKKLMRTEEILGCKFSELMKYLERKFKKGMTWKNRIGTWHLDHIIPVSKFDLTKPEDFRRCFHYTNLQPLFIMDNIKKSNKILPHTQINLAI